MKKSIYLFTLFLLVILTSCQNDDTPTPTIPERKYIEGAVYVGIDGSATTQQIFDYINASGQLVHHIDSIKFESALDVSQLNFVKSYFLYSSYLDNATFPVNAYVDSQDNKIKLSAYVYTMHEAELQAEFLNDIQNLQLTEIPSEEIIILFNVPEGEEKQWVKNFEQMELTRWADLAYFAEETE